MSEVIVVSLPKAHLGVAQGSKGQILPKNQDFRKELEIAIFKFFDFLHEVGTLKALQTGIEVALSKYLFYGQLGDQKGSKGICMS